jgi:hypothetical protein
MSYEVFNEYRAHPRYNEFMGRLYGIVNQMKELKNWYYKQIRKANRSNQIIDVDDVYKKYIYLRQQKLDELHPLEREYGFYSEAPFTEGFY